MSEAQELVQDCGIYPYLDRVLVKPDEIEDTTEGGIIIAQQIAEQHQQAQATGTLVAIGPDAFIHSRTEVYDSEGRLKELRIERYSKESIPKIGDRVQFAKYGGLVNIGADGQEYRVLNDRDITCQVNEGVKYTGIQSRKPLGVKK